MGLEYTLRLAEHGRLSGDVLIVGSYAGPFGVDMQTRKLVIHSYVANGSAATVRDAQRLAKKVEKPVPREYIADYPDFAARFIPLDFFRIDIHEDPSARFPNADIAFVDGGVLAKVYPVKPKGAMLYDIPRKNLGVLAELINMYEGQYRAGMIANREMMRIERDMWLPLYWFRTRRIEKIRRHLFRAARRGRKEEAGMLRQKLDNMVEALNRKATLSPSAS